MSEQIITGYANGSVKTLAAIAPHFDLLKNATFEVQIEGDDLAIIIADGEDFFIEVHRKEVPTIGSGRCAYRPAYVPGYYKHHGGYGMTPPEVDEVQLDECSNVIDAVAKLIELDFIQRADDIVEAEAFLSNAGDIFEESA